MNIIKRLWNYITSSKHPVADFIWQLDHDIDVLNAMIVEATREIKKGVNTDSPHLHVDA